jgi:hypothetical protein
MTVEEADTRDPDVICTWIAEAVQRHGRFKSLTLHKVEEKPGKPERFRRV